VLTSFRRTGRPPFKLIRWLLLALGAVLGTARADVFTLTQNYNGLVTLDIQGTKFYRSGNDAYERCLTSNGIYIPCYVLMEDFQQTPPGWPGPTPGFGELVLVENKTALDTGATYLFDYVYTAIYDHKGELIGLLSADGGGDNLMAGVTFWGYPFSILDSWLDSLSDTDREIVLSHPLIADPGVPIDAAHITWPDGSIDTIRVQFVPEPSSVALLGLVLLSIGLTCSGSSRKHRGRS